MLREDKFSGVDIGLVVGGGDVANGRIRRSPMNALVESHVTGNLSMSCRLDLLPLIPLLANRCLRSLPLRREKVNRELPRVKNPRCQAAMC